jgi:hypothetical protein
MVDATLLLWYEGLKIKFLAMYMVMLVELQMCCLLKRVVRKMNGEY